MNGNERAGAGTPPGLPAPRARRTYRLPEVADLLSISRRTVSRLIAEGELEAVPIGHIRQVPHESIEAYIERQRGKRDELQAACDRMAAARAARRSRPAA